MPVLHLVVGPHGAGKSTLYEVLLAPRHPGLSLVDADLGVDCPDLLRSGQPFVAESAFWQPEAPALIADARALGYEVVLWCLALDEPRKLLQRVNQRAREGGTARPSHEVLDRFPRTLENIRRAVRMADMVFLMDAADAHDGGPRLVASLVLGQMHLHTALRPRWVEKVLGFAEA
jgi:predicted ABC-type ATPase